MKREAGLLIFFKLGSQWTEGLPPLSYHDGGDLTAESIVRNSRFDVFSVTLPRHLSSSPASTRLGGDPAELSRATFYATVRSIND